MQRLFAGLRRRRHFLWLTSLLATALLFTGCATTPDSATPPKAKVYPGIPADAGVAVGFPKQLDGFTFLMLEASPDAAIGTRLVYGSHAFPELTLTVFAYLIGFSSDPAVVLDDFENAFAPYMDAAVDQGAYQAYSLQDQGRVTIVYPFGNREGVWQQFSVTRDDVVSLSAMYQFYRPPFAVKLRATHPPNITGEMLRRHIDHFASQLLPKLEIRRNQGCDKPITINVDPDGTSEQFVEAVSTSLLAKAQAGCGDYDQIKLIAELTKAKAQEESKAKPKP